MAVLSVRRWARVSVGRAVVGIRQVGGIASAEGVDALNVLGLSQNTPVLADDTFVVSKGEACPVAGATTDADHADCSVRQVQHVTQCDVRGRAWDVLDDVVAADNGVGRHAVAEDDVDRAGQRTAVCETVEVASDVVAGPTINDPGTEVARCDSEG